MKFIATVTAGTYSAEYKITACNYELAYQQAYKKALQYATNLLNLKITIKQK